MKTNRRPSPALVVAIIALVVAMTGTATAAKTLISSSTQIRTGAGVWRTEVRTHVGKKGRYSAAVSRAGVYRVVVRRIAGPVVRLR